MAGPRGHTRREILTWNDVDELVDVLAPQLHSAGPFDAMVLITRGGIIPGGLLSEAMDIRYLLTAAVRFPAGSFSALGKPAALASHPEFLQFPNDALLQGRRTLIVDDVWGSGRTSTAVRSRVETAGVETFTCVFHFNPYRSLFTKAKPDFYGAITDAYIVYPWEIDRGMRGIDVEQPKFIG
ncbi:MAG: phosphoribosyltransferase [Anaerolineae bacterium]|nr:phosphoribosyltransferase [Anaerolineae bacterium]